MEDNTAKGIHQTSLHRFWLSLMAMASLIGAICLCLLFFRSFQWDDCVMHASDDGKRQSVESNCGELFFIAEWDEDPLELPHWFHYPFFASQRYDQMFGASTSRWLPLKYGSYSTPDHKHYSGIIIPMWVPIVTCLGLSVFCFRKLTRQSRSN